jgi:hypothetical protein
VLNVRNPNKFRILACLPIFKQNLSLVSHPKERAEKVCLNCKAELFGKYCHICGQENREPKESFWGLISHFFYDITHFDGSFFRTVGKLITRPGVLSREYIAGRRASYLNPIRMYVFTSALFFIIFYSVFSVKNLGASSDAAAGFDSTFINSSTRDVALKGATNDRDSAEILEGFDVLKKTPLGNDSLRYKSLFFSGPRSRESYDSLQRSLPPEKRDSWLKRKLNYRAIDINKRYQKNEREFWKDLLDVFIHSFPYLLFLSLPLYALFLKLLYIRRKQFFYTDHGIFLIHLYIFTFIVLLALFGLMKLDDAFDTSLFNWIQFLLILFGIWYTVAAMRNFYRQGRTKTIVKFLLFNFLAFISITFLFVFFFIVSIFRV